MGAVGVEEAAAVGPQLFDGDLRRRRALGQDLRLARQGAGCHVSVVILHHPLADQDEGQDERQRHQDVERRAHQVGPEVAQRDRRLAGQTARQGQQDGDTGCRAEEVLDGQAERLCQLAHGRLPGI